MIPHVPPDAKGDAHPSIGRLAARLWGGERGQDAIEWVLVALLLAVTTAAIVVTLGESVQGGYADVKECVALASGEGRGPPDAPSAGSGGRGPPECRF